MPLRSYQYNCVGERAKVLWRISVQNVLQQSTLRRQCWRFSLWAQAEQRQAATLCEDRDEQPDCTAIDIYSHGTRFHVNSTVQRRLHSIRLGKSVVRVASYVCGLSPQESWPSKSQETPGKGLIWEVSGKVHSQNGPSNFQGQHCWYISHLRPVQRNLRRPGH